MPVASVTAPNILLITSDQQRADCFGFEGRKVRTPHLDRMASHGLRFSACITPSPVCQPARASILTGQLGLTCGVHDNGIDLDPAVGHKGFAGTLSRHGWDTAFFGKAHFSTYHTFEPTGTPECVDSSAAFGPDWFGPYMGFRHVEMMLVGHNWFLPERPPRGLHYERWYHADGDGDEKNRLYRMNGGDTRGAAQTWHSQLPVAWHNSTWTADRAIDWLKRPERARSPFCAWVSFPDPHHPFDCPEPWSRLHRPADVDLPLHRSRDLDDRPWWHRAAIENEPQGPAENVMTRKQYSRLPPQTDAQLREIIANTYGQISLIDHQVGRILIALEEAGLAEDTIVVFTSDHGDWLGDHGLVLKGPMFYEGLLRVGMIVKGPGVPAGRVIDEPVSTIDLAPTFLDLAGATPLLAQHGSSLRPFLEGRHRRTRVCAQRVGTPSRPCRRRAEPALRADTPRQADPRTRVGRGGNVRPRERPARDAQPFRQRCPQGIARPSHRTRACAPGRCRARPRSGRHGLNARTWTFDQKETAMIRTSTFRLAWTTALATALAMAAPAAQAQWKPKGPITMMIGFTAGGSADTQARLIADELEARKGWKVIPEPVLGKGGGVLAARLAKAPADGTALGMIVSETVTYNMLAEKKPGYTADDFTYLTTTAGTEMGIVARANKGWKTLSDVTSAMKKGQQISFGAMSQKLADGAYLLGKAQGVKYNIVNLKGGKAVMDAITAGDIDIGWVAGLQTRGVQSGDLVNLASGETTRLKASPDAPTVKELGLDADYGVYFMFVAPKGLPDDARAAITDAIKDIVNDPNSKAHAFIVKNFGEPKTISDGDLQQYIHANLAKSKALLDAALK